MSPGPPAGLLRIPWSRVPPCNGYVRVPARGHTAARVERRREIRLRPAMHRSPDPRSPALTRRQKHPIPVTTARWINVDSTSRHGAVRYPTRSPPRPLRQKSARQTGQTGFPENAKRPSAIKMSPEEYTQTRPGYSSRPGDANRVSVPADRVRYQGGAAVRHAVNSAPPAQLKSAPVRHKFARLHPPKVIAPECRRPAGR
ncbi:hypothetical protein D3C78_853270 [compost metagenome]